MFDLITGNVTHAPRPRTAPVIVSIAAHAALVGAVVVGTVMFVHAPIPELPMMMAFVAPPPPPPPPPPPALPPVEKARTLKPLPTSGDVAPVEPPMQIEPEAPVADIGEGEVIGGVPGGIAGGVIGGVMAEIPPPPPPPPPAPRAPIRMGGQLKEPTLIHRVDPEYPMLALVRQMEGVVILEAIVDEEGRVESLKVLRSPGVFEEAALAAVRQWRYSPVLLNGRPEKFILTVVVSFHLEK
ncbi:MAG TPA: TonB family protein [Vicinamibacterales bacterium]